MDDSITRRIFLQRAATASTAVGMSIALSGCALLEDTSHTTEEGRPDALTRSDTTSSTEQARVAFVKTTDRADGALRAMALLDTNDWTDQSVFIKPNFNSADPAPGSTHPAILRTLIETLHANNVGPITIADRSGMGNTRQVMAQLGIDSMAEELGCTLVSLDDLPADQWEIVNPETSHWQQGFPFPRLVHESDVVIQLCCLKTHRYGGHFTLSLKNSVGLAAKYLPGDGYNYMNELHRSPNQRAMIAEINTAYRPDLIIMDGVEAFVRGGPATGEIAAANVLLAGTDRVALDAVGVALLRHFGTTAEVSQGPIFEQEQIARAIELDIGIRDAAQINLITDDAASRAYADEIQTILKQG